MGFFFACRLGQAKTGIAARRFRPQPAAIPPTRPPHSAPFSLKYAAPLRAVHRLLASHSSITGTDCPHGSLRAAQPDTEGAPKSAHKKTPQRGVLSKLKLIRRLQHPPSCARDDRPALHKPSGLCRRHAARTSGYGYSLPDEPGSVGQAA